MTTRLGATAPVTSSVEGGVGTITLNRPEALNALNLPMAQRFLEILAEFDADDAVRAILLRGAGSVFSAGGDIREMLADVRGGGDRAAYFKAPLSSFGEMVMALRESPKPVLAAVQGAVVGVAFSLMLACDLKIAQEGTRFTQAFMGTGLSPDGGGTWLLPRLVGQARACELVMLPTELDAQTALQWGLINWVAEVDSFEVEVERVSSRLSRGPRRAMARAKTLLNSAHARDLPEQIEAERLAQVENAASADFEDGLTAFLEKRAPRFGG